MPWAPHARTHAFSSGSAMLSGTRVSGCNAIGQVAKTAMPRKYAAARACRRRSVKLRARTVGLRRPGVADDAVQRLHAVSPTDLLALGIGAAAVRDAHLVDSPALPRHLGRDLGFDAEAVFVEVEGLHDLPAERLVTGLHVGEVEVGGHVGNRRQETVADGVPVVEDPVGAAGVEAGAEYDIGAPVEKGLQHRVVVGRVVL